MCNLHAISITKLLSTHPLKKTHIGKSVFTLFFTASKIELVSLSIASHSS
ncbi:MAG: hypothetical protein WCG25_05095 [bacterium]